MATVGRFGPPRLPRRASACNQARARSNCDWVGAGPGCDPFWINGLMSALVVGNPPFGTPPMVSYSASCFAVNGS